MSPFGAARQQSSRLSFRVAGSTPARPPFIFATMSATRGRGAGGVRSGQPDNRCGSRSSGTPTPARDSAGAARGPGEQATAAEFRPQRRPPMAAASRDGRRRHVFMGKRSGGFHPGVLRLGGAVLPDRALGRAEVDGRSAATRARRRAASRSRSRGIRRTIAAPGRRDLGQPGQAADFGRKTAPTSPQPADRQGRARRARPRLLSRRIGRQRSTRRRSRTLPGDRTARSPAQALKAEVRAAAGGVMDPSHEFPLIAFQEAPEARGVHRAHVEMHLGMNRYSGA